MIEIEKIQKIIEDFRLDYRGFPSLNKIREKINDYNIIKECIEIIPKIFDEPLETKHRYKLNSYKGKHIVEKKLNKYVSNGEFIIAMIFLEYGFQVIPKSLNCIFVCKEKNLK